MNQATPAPSTPAPTIEQMISNICKDLNTLTFSKNYPVLKKSLFSKSVKPATRIAIGTYFFRKIYYYFKPSSEDRDRMIKAVISAIEESNNIIVKAKYLEYSCPHALRDVCTHFYKHRFPKVFFLLQMMNDQSLISMYDISEMEEHFVRWIREEDLTFEQKSNLLDVLLRYFPKNADLKKIRDDLSGGSNLSFYENKQNAHDEVLNQETIQKALLLFQDTTKYHKADSNPYKEMPELLEEWYGKSDVLDGILTRTKIDNTQFGDPDIRMFSISSLLYEILLFIQNAEPDLRENLKRRLFEEFEDVGGLCSTAYVMRFMNIFRGYVEKYEANIDFKDQLFSKVSIIVSEHFLRKGDRVPEEVVFGTYDPEYKNAYVNYVLELIRDHIPALCADYGEADVKANLNQVMSRFLEDVEIEL